MTHISAMISIRCFILLFGMASFSVSTCRASELGQAVTTGNIETVQKVLATKPEPDARDSFGGTALHAAVLRKNMEIVELLIAYGCDINVQGTSNGYTPLHDAVWANNPEAAKILLRHGANTRIKAKDGLTPLEKAVREGKTELADLLRKADK